MTSRCDVTDLPTDQCAHCLGHTGHPDKVDGIGHIVIADYHGECAHCGDRITVGAFIRLGFTDDAEPRWCIAEHTR